MRASEVTPGTAVVGLQWGDEGKGKIIDLIAPGFSAVVRYNGGANAGHSVVIGGERHALHLVPSGVFHRGCRAVIGNGVVVDPFQLVRELDGLAGAGVETASLAVSDRAHLVMPYHQAEDAWREGVLAGGGEIGTTRRGIGPAYAEKATRSAAVRMGDLYRPEVLRERVERACSWRRAVLGDAAAEALDVAALLDRLGGVASRLRAHVTDTGELLQGLIRGGERVLFEGANATLLDVDHGTFPYVTSSSTSSLGVPAGAGVPARAVGTVVGVAKSYCTRVGAGPMPTELEEGADGGAGERIRERGREYGTTTGRPRRCGWLDLVSLRYAVMLNGVDEIALTLLDVLSGFEELKLCTAYRIGVETTDRFCPDASDLGAAEPVYESVAGFGGDLGGVRTMADLPSAARAYVERVGSFVGAPVTIIGVGPDREQTIRV